MRSVLTFPARIRRWSRPANRLSLTITWVLAGTFLIQGVGIWLGGPIRWSGPGYSVVRQLPGSPYSWAVTAAAAGLVVVAGLVTHHFWIKALGLGLASAWCGAFTIGGLWTIAQIPISGTTGPPTYAGLAVITALMIFVDERPPDAPTRPSAVDNRLPAHPDRLGSPEGLRSPASPPGT